MALPFHQQHGYPALQTAVSTLPQYGSIDDMAAMAVLATIGFLYLFHGFLWDKPDRYIYKMYERPQEKMTSGQKASESTRDIAIKLEQTNAEIIIFWGSQSGTAERFANRLCREISQRFGKKALPADISDYEPSSLEKIPRARLAIFIVSTYGEGEPSDNMAELWGWLETDPTSTLTSMRYAAFGLGNSNYKYYNAVVDIVTNKLNGLGANSILPVGKADDAKGETEEDYLVWKDKLFEYFKTSLGYEEQDAVYEPCVNISEHTLNDSHDLFKGRPWTQNTNRNANRSISPCYSLPVKASRELFDDHTDRNCIHMEVDLSDHPGLKYKTGDHFGVWASNPIAEVERLISCLGLQERRAVPLKIDQTRLEGKPKVPSPTDIDALFGYYLEICAPVSRETVALLVQFAPSSNAKDTLGKLSNDKSAYSQLLETTCINLGRLLELAASGEGSWRDLPLSFVVEVLPSMQPRYYSISSSSVVQPRQLAITAVVADRVLAGDDQRVSGLCTNYLLGKQATIEGSAHPYDIQYPSTTSEDSHAGRKLFAHVRKSTFKLPALSSRPIIMFAAGTGIAPFRAFLQERARLARMGRPIGRTILFFGCRNDTQDFIYRDELDAIQKSLGSSFTIITAFSRPDNGSRAYVQDRIPEHSSELTELIIQQEANLYMCGSAAMARDVSKVLGDLLRASQEWDESEIRQFMERQRKLKRWQQDVWG